VLNEVENSIRDRSLKNWKELENEVVSNPLRNAYFGDLHVHTRYSHDAYIGGATASPEDAYLFAKGHPISVLGKEVRIQRPLDFAAVTDHSEFLGEFYSLQHKGSPGYFSSQAMYLRSLEGDTSKQLKMFARMRGASQTAPRQHPKFFKGFKTTMRAWTSEIEAAEKHYLPGKFTTFAAYEWSHAEDGAHLHRNVIFKDMIVPDYPVSALEARTEKALWKSMETYRKSGATVMAIPHNSNLSYGKTFPLSQEDGTAVDVAYAKERSANEPLAEIHQAKGNSEVHPAIWTDDEYADFEINNEEITPNQNSYLRHILKRGLAYQENLGVNPFKYGFIGSTDTHNGTPGNTEEDDEYQGNHLIIDGDANFRSTTNWVLNDRLKTYAVTNPGGLVGIWAKANTRSHLFEAMQQKETFATSGTRITLRLFAGYDFKETYDSHESMLQDGYAKGVPMGGDLAYRTDQIPQLIIWAAKDASSANLDRIQVIKGWYDGDSLHEEIFDAVVSQNAVLDGENIVNLTTGEIDKTKGSPTLFTVWSDATFDPSLHTFFYIRVLEVPTPRYSLLDEIRHGVKYPDDAKRIIRERAWSSPIWGIPSKSIQ
jgi:hypothetical protein